MIYFVKQIKSGKWRLYKTWDALGIQKTEVVRDGGIVQRDSKEEIIHYCLTVFGEEPREELYVRDSRKEERSKGLSMLFPRRK